MLELKDFDGTSSRDAPGFEQRDPHDYFWFGLWAIAHDIAIDAWRWLGSASRKKRVKRLKEEMLPQFPNTIICPRCLITIERP